MKQTLKKAISFLCVLSMMFSLIISVQAAGIQIESGKATLVQGTGEADVEIPLTLSGNTGIAGMTLKVSYTEGLTLKNITQGSGLPTLTLTKPGDYSANPFNLVWDGQDADNISGIVATLTFSVPKKDVKTYSINIATAGVFDNDLNNVNMAIVNGEISVTEKPKEDFKGLSLNDKEFDYDGTEKSIAVTGTLPTGAKVEYTNEKATNAGTYNVSAKITADGYNDKILNATMTIKPRTLTVTGLSAENKTYDGTDNAAIKGGELNGVIKGDDVKAAFPTMGRFAKSDVGTGIAVTVADITLDGSAKDNYKLTQPTGLKANITQAPITIKADDKQMVKGAAIPELTYKITSGQLFAEDKVSGTPATAANGSKLGDFDITQGTLTVSSNYKLTFEKGKLSVVDKTPQNITVSEITEKTYGDTDFKVEVTKDAVSNLDAFTFTSSNPSVAEISTDGTVTIKAAGETNITVKQAGNDTYAPFEKTQKLVVKKVAITVMAEAKSKKIGAADPELTFTYAGDLVGDDKFTGKLERQVGEDVGKYDILIGTLAINNNYDIIYNKAVFEIFDKTPQNIIVADFGEKTYGDAAFAVSVTADTAANLTNYTFESDNTDVAEITADGNITIKAAGEANITVKEPGNDEYASFEKTVKLVVKKKAVTVTSVDIENKTAVLDGVLAEDAENVTLDFDKITIEQGEAVDETTSNITLKNFVLKGDKAANYELTTETLPGTIANDNIVDITITAENGVVTGAAKYIKGSSVTVTATANSGYRFTGWYVDNTAVSTESTYTFTAESDTALTAKFERIRTSGGGGGGTTRYTVSFETNGGSKVANQSVTRNSVMKEPAAPTKEGFDFAGWYTDKELKTKYDFSAKVTKSLTLYAAWTEKDNTLNQIVLTIGEKSATVFGQTKSNDVAPKIVNDRTMLPARFVAESLGAVVTWNGEKQEVTIKGKNAKNEDITILIYIDSDIAYVNDEQVKLDSPAFIENDRTYTPIRFISEQLGASVEWNETDKTVTITK